MKTPRSSFQRGMVILTKPRPTRSIPLGLEHGRMTKGGHGFPKVPSGPAMPYPSTPVAVFYPFGHPTPYAFDAHELKLGCPDDKESKPGQIVTKEFSYKRSHLGTDFDTNQVRIPPKSSQKHLGKKYFTIFSDFTSNIHRSPKKLQDKKSYSQFLGAKSTSIRDCVGRSVGLSVCPHDAITWKTSYVAIASRRGGGRGKLVTSRFLRT
jgi:hypothetical protein